MNRRLATIKAASKNVTLITISRQDYQEYVIADHQKMIKDSLKFLWEVQLFQFVPHHYLVKMFYVFKLVKYVRGFKLFKEG